jgi:hypothetical protein
MGKTLISLVMSALSLFSGCAFNNSRTQIWDSIEKNPPANFQEVEHYIQYDLFYKSERGDCWNSAKKAIEKGYGDCEEIATAGAYLAEKLGYPPKLLNLVEQKDGGHVVTLLEKQTENGIKYGAIEKTDLIEPEYNSIDEVVNKLGSLIGANYGYYSILDLNSFDKNWRTSSRNLLSNKNKRYPLVQVKKDDESKNFQIKKKGYIIGGWFGKIELIKQK